MDALGGGYGVHDRKDGSYEHVLTGYYVHLNAHVHLFIHLETIEVVVLTYLGTLFHAFALFTF